MRACPPNLRRRVATALLSLVTLAGAGTLSAQADNGNDNGGNFNDLVITKSVAEHVGSTVRYRIEVTNNGPRPGTQVRIHDTVPVGVSVTEATVTEGANESDFCTVADDHRTVDCTIHGEINPTPPQPPQNGRPRVVVEIVGTLTGDGRVCNTATVSGNHQDTDTNNNTSGLYDACTVIEPPTTLHADLHITKAADPLVISAGKTLTYTLTVTNTGPGASSDAIVSDLLPSGLTFVSAVPSQGTCNMVSNLSCSLGAIAPNGSATVTIKVVPTSVVAGSDVTNCATVSDANDPTDNEPGCVTITVKPQADLSIKKLVDKSVALVGEDLTYTITVTNNGPNTATNVVVTDDIPSQATLQSATTPPPGSCSTPLADQPRHVVCNLGSLTSGTTATVTITVKATVKGLRITNTASVTSAQDDPKTSDNASSAVTNAFASLEGSGAFGEFIDVKTLLGLHVQSGPLASVALPAGGGGPISASAVKVYVTGGFLLNNLVRLDALSGTTQGGKTANGNNVYVKSSADVAKVSLVNGLVTVDKLHSECYADSSPSGNSSSNIVKLRVLGVEVKVAAGPNSKVVVPGVGELILNEQVNDYQGPFLQTRTVNALHLKLYGPLAWGDVILAQAKCRIDP